VLGARTGGASATLEVTRPLSSCLLDIMGLAGFGCTFDALAAEAAPGARSPTELATAFGTMLDAASGAFVPTLLEWLFPVLRALVRRATIVAKRVGPDEPLCSRQTAQPRCARRSTPCT
jgi:hypothetical protein